MKLTNENKFSIAQVIADMAVSNGVTSTMVVNNRKFYFSDIINSSIVLNGKLVALKATFSEDDCLHITNLVIGKITNAPVSIGKPATVDFK